MKNSVIVWKVGWSVENKKQKNICGASHGAAFSSTTEETVTQLRGNTKRFHTAGLMWTKILYWFEKIKKVIYTLSWNLHCSCATARLGVSGHLDLHRTNCSENLLYSNSCFSCLRESCNTVYLWSSRNVSWMLKETQILGQRRLFSTSSFKTTLNKTSKIHI